MHQLSGTVEPIYGITDDNQGGLAIVFAIGSVAFSLSFASVRLAVFMHKRQSFAADDALISLSLLLATVQSFIVGYSVHDGLGRHVASLSNNQITNYFKFIYASRIVAIASRGCAKSSVAILYQRLKLYRGYSKMLALLLCIAAWSLFSTFALAFQCRFPSPWLISSSNCPSGSSLIIAIAVLDVFTDFLLVLYPIPALLSLNLRKTFRLKYIAIFSSRILTCVMVVIDVVLAVQRFYASDPTWDNLEQAITGIILVHVSLITAIALRTQDFIMGMHSGQTSARLPTPMFRSLWSARRSTNLTRSIVANAPDIIEAESSSGTDKDGSTSENKAESGPSLPHHSDDSRDRQSRSKDNWRKWR